MGLAPWWLSLLLLLLLLLLCVWRRWLLRQLFVLGEQVLCLLWLLLRPLLRHIVAHSPWAPWGAVPLGLRTSVNVVQHFGGWRGHHDRQTQAARLGRGHVQRLCWRLEKAFFYPCDSQCELRG